MFFFFDGESGDSFPADVRSFLQKDAMTWSELEQLLIVFRDKRPDLTIGAFVTFLFIARRTANARSVQKANLTIKSVSEQLEISYPTAARHCDLLSEGVRGKVGLGWIKKEVLDDQRSKSVALSDSGVEVLSNAIAFFKKSDFR